MPTLIPGCSQVSSKGRRMRGSGDGSAPCWPTPTISLSTTLSPRSSSLVDPFRSGKTNGRPSAKSIGSLKQAGSLSSGGGSPRTSLSRWRARSGTGSGGTGKSRSTMSRRRRPNSGRSCSRWESRTIGSASPSETTSITGSGWSFGSRSKAKHLPRCWRDRPGNQSGLSFPPRSWRDPRLRSRVRRRWSTRSSSCRAPGLSPGDERSNSSFRSAVRSTRTRSTPSTASSSASFTKFLTSCPPPRSNASR